MLDFSHLNNEQLEAVTASEGPILIVAGAGTGKTRVLTSRIAYLIDKLGYNHNRILAITFTNKAANEMRNRISKIISDVHVPWIGTYHATCLKILREDIHHLGRKNDFNVIDDEDQLGILREIYQEGNYTQKDIKSKKALEIISFLKNNDIDLNRVQNIDELRQIGIFRFDILKMMKFIFQKYKDKLRLSNLLDFDDLLLLARKLLSDFTSVQSKWQEKFDCILVDEFQDTNLIQFELLNLLIHPQKRHVFVVGDPDQTIYTWRGAYANIFNDYLHTYKTTKTIVLDINYRSTKKILDVANILISHNKNRIPKDLTTNNTEGKDIHFYNAESNYLEASYVCKQVLELTKNNSHQFHDIVILYRAKYLSRAIEQELINNNIPYYVYGAVRFYQRREIKDLIAYLKLIVDPYDDLALKRVLNVPSRNIGKVTFDKIVEYANRHHLTFAEVLWDKNNHANWSTTTINNFLSLIRTLIEESKNLSIVDTMKLIIKKINYEEYLRSLDLAEERIQNTQELLTSIEEYENKKSNRVVDFLNEISLYTDNDDNNQQRKNTISLMTIHYAKGMEFKTVFLIGLCEGIFPHITINSENDIEEERRIAYVAITRTMERLFLTSHGGYSVINNQHFVPSRFIREIGSNHYVEDTNEFKTISKEDLHWYDSRKIVDYSQNYQKQTVNFRIGDVIAHTIFGSGVVVGFKDDMIDILFKAPYGHKSLIKTHKSIKRLKN